MPALAAGRVVRTVVLGAGALLLALVADASPAAAHSAGGGTLPVPPWLLSYLGVAIVVLTATAVRAGWATTAAPAADTPAPAAPEVPPVRVGNVVGLTLFLLVLLGAIVGPDSGAANVAPVAVLVVWWVGLVVASLVAGDVMRAVNPFTPVVALLERRTVDRAGVPPAWTAAAFLAAFQWYFVAYHRPGSPRALAVLLLLYAGAAVLGGLRWGRGWLATGEAFGAVSAAVARLAPWRRAGAAPPGLAALMVVWLGGVSFDAFVSTPFWADVVGARQGWSFTLVSTIGLVWLTAVVAGIYLGALRLAERSRTGPGTGAEPNEAPATLTTALGTALVPLAVGWFLAHDLTLLLFEGQNFVALLSDPIGRGWDLLGTIDRTIDYGIVQATWVRWAQVAMLAVGHVGAVMAAHDAARRHVAARAAMRATWAMAAASSASIVAAALLVLG